MTITTGTLTDNGDTPELKGEGTFEQCLFKGDFGGGTVELQISQDNGAVYYPTGDKFSANASFMIDPSKATYKFTLSGATSPSISFAIGGE